MQYFPVRSGPAASCSINFSDDALLFRLTLKIELVQLFRNLFATRGVFAGEELDLRREQYPFFLQR